MERSPEDRKRRTTNFLVSAGIVGGLLAWAWFDPGGYLLGDQESQVSTEDSSGGSGTLGETLTTRDGVSLGVKSVAYAAEPPRTSLISEPLGDFATVTFVVENGSSESLRFSIGRLTATIAGASYEPSALVSQEGDYLGFSERINPGLSRTMVVYFDIPVGATLDTFEYDSVGLGNDSLRFYLSE